MSNRDTAERIVRELGNTYKEFQGGVVFGKASNKVAVDAITASLGEKDQQIDGLADEIVKKSKYIVLELMPKLAEKDREIERLKDEDNFNNETFEIMRETATKKDSLLKQVMGALEFISSKKPDDVYGMSDARSLAIQALSLPALQPYREGKK